MFVQILSIRTAPEAIPRLRHVMQHERLAQMLAINGLLAVHLMAHVDQQDTAKLMVFWESEAAMRAVDAEQYLPLAIAGISGLPWIKLSHETYAAQALA